jgi:hypothetical protein
VPARPNGGGMTDRDQILRDAVLVALERHARTSALSVASVATAAARVLDEPPEPNRVVLPILQALQTDGSARNVSDNPQRTAWRFVSDAERLAEAERTSLRSRARAAAAALQAVGVASATANRGAVRVSISATDAERLAAVLSDLATCDGVLS